MRYPFRRGLVCVCVRFRGELIVRSWRSAPTSRLLGVGPRIRHLLPPPRFQIEYDSEAPELRLLVCVSYRYNRL